MTAPTFFIDNNLPPRLAVGMRGFGENFVHLKDEWPEDADDVDFLPVIGARGWILVTKDEAMRTVKAELAALRQHRIRAFWLGGKGMSFWSTVEQVVANYRQMKEHVDKYPGPFVF
ncbi:MAG TPA: hypothetical protein VGO93_29905, partial [Candidatus Xenobia bacterium]